jgi:hypothetical protein
VLLARLPPPVTDERAPRTALQLLVALGATAALYGLWRRSAGAAILIVAGLMMLEGVLGFYHRRVHTHSRITGMIVTYTGVPAMFWSAFFFLGGCWTAAVGLYRLRPSLF